MAAPSVAAAAPARLWTVAVRSRGTSPATASPLRARPAPRAAGLTGATRAPAQRTAPTPAVTMTTRATITLLAPTIAGAHAAFISVETGDRREGPPHLRPVQEGRPCLLLQPHRLSRIGYPLPCPPAGK